MNSSITPIRPGFSALLLVACLGCAQAAGQVTDPNPDTNTTIGQSVVPVQAAEPGQQSPIPDEATDSDKQSSNSTETNQSNRVSANSSEAIGSTDPATAAEQQQAQAPRGSARQIEEIVVFPLLRRRDLRVRIENAEDNLFARFNELNEDDEFDIVCYRMKRTSSHISRRVCDPQFFLDAESDNASQSAYLIAQGNGGGAYLMSRNELKSYLQPKFVELQQRMEQLTASDGEFRNLTQELLDAMESLESYGQD